MKQWHYAKNGQKFGPFQKSHIEELYNKGELAPTDLVWEEGSPNWVPARDALTVTPPPLTVSVAPLSLPDYGGFLCWGIPLTLIPYLGAIPNIIIAIFICLEISAARQQIQAGKLRSSTYGELHPAVGFLMVFCCGLFLYPLLMHWRNQSGYFKPQPHAVWFSVVILVLGFLLSVCLALLFIISGGLK